MAWLGEPTALEGASGDQVAAIAGNLALMRLVLMRAVLMCWCVCLPVVVMWSNAEGLLLAAAWASS